MLLFALSIVMFLKFGKVPDGLGFRLERVLAWLDPEKYYEGKGYQILQSLYGIGSGGIFGKHLGKSMQKMGFLSEAKNDMIFSVICEELGLVGGFSVIAMYVLLLWKIRDVSLYCKDYFGNLLITGIFAHIAIQVVMNIAVATNIMPNTGVSLPFISYGGSSLMILMAEMGIVFNIGRYAKFAEEEPDDEEETPEAD
jgi:cell division protein FtsW